MNPHEIFDAIMSKSLEHGIDFNFLYPAVLSVSDNINCNDDRIFRAYFDRETQRLAGGPPSEARPASEDEISVFGIISYMKDVRFYLRPGVQVISLHLDIYQRAADAASDMKTRFCLQACSNEIHIIVRELCGDIIQTLHNRQVTLN